MRLNVRCMSSGFPLECYCIGCVHAWRGPRPGANVPLHKGSQQRSTTQISCGAGSKKRLLRKTVQIHETDTCPFGGGGIAFLEMPCPLSTCAGGGIASGDADVQCPFQNPGPAGPSPAQEKQGKMAPQAEIWKIWGYGEMEAQQAPPRRKK
eukprot:gene22075-biopygen8715